MPPPGPVSPARLRSAEPRRSENSGSISARRKAAACRFRAPRPGLRFFEKGSAGNSLPCAVNSAVQRPISVSPSISRTCSVFALRPSRSMSVFTLKARRPAGRHKSKVRRRTAKPDCCASRSTSRVISAVVALPCSMSGDHGPPACSVARNKGPSGLKMAVMGRAPMKSLRRFLWSQPYSHNNRGGYVDGGMRRPPLSGRPIRLFSGPHSAGGRP